ncbi:DUF4262 domain-containing protein [Arthrobacter sp.]|uniref:DUF4262 domain-containing protein n=1 Tax=Arthrobacter sp. TaxID=1667 RepID=UPI003A90DFEE
MCQICDGMSVEEAQRREDRQIARVGWTIQHVESEDPSGRLSYTIGLSKLRHPELVMLGSPPQLAQAVLMDAAAQVRGKAHRFEVGGRWSWAGRRYRVANGRHRTRLLLGARRRYGKGITAVEFIADTPWWGREAGG